MKRIALLTTVALVTFSFGQTPAPSQPWGANAAWDFRTNQPVALVTNSLKSTKVGRDWIISADAFAGTTLQGTTKGFSQGLTGGGGLSLTYSYKQLAFTSGLGAGLFAGDSPHVIGYAGIKIGF